MASRQRTPVIIRTDFRLVGKAQNGRPDLLQLITKPGDAVVHLLEVSMLTILRPCDASFEVIRQAYGGRIIAGEPLKGRHNSGGTMESSSLI